MDSWSKKHKPRDLKVQMLQPQKSASRNSYCRWRSLVVKYFYSHPTATKRESSEVPSIFGLR